MHPADDALAVEDHGRRGVDVLAGQTRALVDQRDGLRDVLLLVGDEPDALEVQRVPRLVRAFEVVDGDGEDLDAALLELLVVLFELTELDDAEASPVTAIEHENGPLVAGE